MNLTAAFADDLIGLAETGLDEAARQAARNLVLDGLAVAALGAGEKGPSILASLAPPAQGPGSAAVIGRTKRATPAEAARINGASMHVLDFEPMWNPANHALSTTLPALLALGESEEEPAGAALGERILTALALGIEAQERLRLASGQFEPGELMFHPPGAVGPLGSAVACGLLLNLDAERLRHAIAIAVSRAGGVQANIGSMTKALHCGQAAASGLESAALAAHGFTADADALGHPRGYGRAFFGEKFRPEELLRAHDALQIVRPGPAYKLYPSQYGTHFVITAALAARAKLPAGARIERVVIHSPPMDYVDRPVPASGLAGKFSFQYTAAVALLDGAVNVASFTDERRFAPDTVALLERIVIVADPSRQGRFDAMTLRIDVDHAGGTVRGDCDGPPGIGQADPERTHPGQGDRLPDGGARGRGGRTRRFPLRRLRGARPGRVAAPHGAAQPWRARGESGMTAETQATGGSQRRVGNIELFLAFSGISIMGFGGVLPWVRWMIVERKGWLDEDEFVNALSLCQILPGGNVVNIAVYIGARFGGLLGAIFAITGLLLAPCLIVIGLGGLYQAYGHLPAVQGMFRGAAACAAGLILGMGLKMALRYRRDGRALSIMAVVVVAMVWFKLPLLVLLATVLPASLALAAWSTRSR